MQLVPWNITQCCWFCSVSAGTAGISSTGMRTGTRNTPIPPRVKYRAIPGHFGHSGQFQVITAGFIISAGTQSKAVLLVYFLSRSQPRCLRPSPLLLSASISHSKFLTHSLSLASLSLSVNLSSQLVPELRVCRHEEWGRDPHFWERSRSCSREREKDYQRRES